MQFICLSFFLNKYQATVLKWLGKGITIRMEISVVLIVNYQTARTPIVAESLISIYIRNNSDTATATTNKNT